MTQTELLHRLRARVAELEKDKAFCLEYLGYMRAPLVAARRQAGPSAEPQNVEVYWHTAADGVVELLAWLDRNREETPDAE